MLHYIKGTLAMKLESSVVVEAGGMGYELSVPANSSIYLAKEGEEVTVFTAMIVREDDISLYGFGEKASLDTFRKLISVSGVGAKAALAIFTTNTEDVQEENINKKIKECHFFLLILYKRYGTIAKNARNWTSTSGLSPAR